jgi:glycerophosphoryl diester phosphodiesterase
MLNIQVVGHRGVRNIEVENTRSSLLKAQEFGVDAVEFDVRLTKDKQLVVCHNRNLRAIYGVNRNIDSLTFDEFKDLRSKNGETIPTLQDILDLGITVPLMMDVKNSGSADLIHKIMNFPKNKRLEWAITTFKWSEAKRFKQIDKNIWVSLGTVFRPFHVIQKAKATDAQAITINLILLNPLNYWLAKRANIKIMLYMNFLPFFLTNPTSVRVITKLYPGVGICTDRPDNIVPLFK